MLKPPRWTMAFVPLLLWSLTPNAWPAETFKTLLNFNGTNGGYPYASLVQGPNGNLYGTATGGGKNNSGTVFEITSAGKLTTLYSFCSKANCADGTFPQASLLLATNGNFYGTTKYGGFACDLGNLGCGTVFEIIPSGKLTTLYTFCVKGGENCSDGANPQAPLIQGTDGNFYGMTFSGGNSNDAGTLFEITAAGKLTTLYTFCSKAGQNCPDGAGPTSVIQGTDGNFYGTTAGGGGVSSSRAENSGDCGGTDWFLERDSFRYFVYYRFCYEFGPAELYGFLFEPESDPPAGSSMPANISEPAAQTLTFYGTGSGGGTNAAGAIYSLTSKKKVKVIYDFCSKTNCADGAYPGAGVTEGTDGNFYGTTAGGNGDAKCPSLNGCGIVYEITSTGSLTTLYSFDSTDGEYPQSALVQATNGTFYGTTSLGGARGDGTVFSLSTGLGPFAKTVPTSGAAGSVVMILGTDLTGAKSVTFNGKPAEFKVVSATEITTTVPSGATTGTVEVTTPRGTLKSFPFQVL
jgi:uncharacterized repeat protein (TIGR03803 family)